MAVGGFLQDLKALFPSPEADDQEGLKRFKTFLQERDNPREILQGIRRLFDLKDPLVAPPESFLRRRPGTQFENWDYPVNLYSLIEIEEGRLLSLPPGSRRFSIYRSTLPDIIDLQIQARFPRLLAELANRPNLFFPGVFFPHELDISNMEMISAHHGTFYVVHGELVTGSKSSTVSVVLKPTDMAVESIITFTLQFINRRLDPAVRRRIGPILAPTIIAIEDVYGVMDLMPGKNGVEFLPRGIKTGTLQDLRSNEYPEGIGLSRDDVMQIAREFAKQAVMAYYMRLYDRKPDQLMIHRGPDGKLVFSHIDFGRALKRNYALPWKRHYDPSRPALNFDVHEIPFFEAAGAFIYLPHFIPASMRSALSPFDGEMRRVIVETFVLLAREVKANADEIHTLFKYLIGRRTQYKGNEVLELTIEPEDIEQVYRSLLTLEDPAEIIESILNLACHEREGTAAIRVEGEDDDSGIYRRAMLSGERVTSLRDKPDGPHPYRLIDYRKRGRVSYDAEQKTLRVEFGEDPEKIVEHIERRYSRQLAAEIRAFSGNLRGVDLTVRSNGDVAVRLSASDGVVGATRRLRFPPNIMREINEAGSGFAPGAHVLAGAAEFRKARRSADDLESETAKETLVLANDLQGKEILQFVMAVEPDASPLRHAMAEMITCQLANPDYLADKDPFDSINRLVVSLGRKHLAQLWPRGADIAEAVLPPVVLGKPGSAARQMLAIYEPVDLSHFVHLILTVRFAEELGRRADLAAGDRTLLLTTAILHDLNVLDPSFRQVLMEPSGRLSRPILASVLDRHAEISAGLFARLCAENRPELAGLDAGAIGSVLKIHHRDPRGPRGRIHQILHLADNIAVFADRTRPDHWIRGFLRLEQIAPRWIDAQLERGQIDREIWQAAQSFFSDPSQNELLRRLDQMSAFYPQCYTALQMAAALHSGLNPQHPNPMADFRERHGADLVNRIFENLMKSGLSIRDKINVINRIDLIAPMFRKEMSGVDAPTFAFINASAQPVQRVVEIIMRMMTEGRKVILMGMLPRVIKTYERLRVHPRFESQKSDPVCVIAGERRLQFVTHSYPYEADFHKPFHVIIRDFREAHRIQESCCLIPFERFMRLYAPTAQAEERIRRLEKASDVEELRGSERVQAEAERYSKWESAHPHALFDDRSNERFRRIIFSGFTNRDVLLFYFESVPGDTAFRNALREVIGALRENPNYLSDRSVHYNLQELVRSLGQIHFYGDSTTDIPRRLRGALKEHGLSGIERRFALLAPLKPVFNFVKQSLCSALQIAVLLGRRFEEAVGNRLSDGDWDRVAAGTFLTGSLLEDAEMADYILSPEDVSTNRAIRGLLADMPIALTTLIRRRSDSRDVMSDPAWVGVSRLLDGSPLQAGDAAPFLLMHTGLLFGAYCDFSKVENWKRGRTHIGGDDLLHLWESISSEFARAGIDFSVGPGAAFDKTVRTFCRTDGPRILNEIARQTHSYVRLFNALTLAAELRYGLSPRGFDVFHNVRTIFGPAAADVIGEGIIGARVPIREKVKFARKLRMFASALSVETVKPGRLMVLSADHPLNTAPMADIRDILRRQAHAPGLIVPAGDYDRVVRLLASTRTRLDPPDAAAFSDITKFLVGEEYPLLIKEKTLRHTEDFRKRIGAWREQEGQAHRNVFVPSSVLTSHETPAPPPERCAAEAEKGLFFFHTWMRLFE